MKMDESTFETLAEATLRRWFDAMEDAGSDILDCELASGVLTIEAEGVGSFVLSRHGPLRQLWLSSPLSGASHYDYDAGSRTWRSTRDEAVLAERLGRELSGIAGRPVTLD